MKRRLVPLATIVFGAALLPVVAPSPVEAEIESASPPSGSVGPGQASLTWSGSDRDAQTGGVETCDVPVEPTVFAPFCSDFSLTVTDLGTVSFSVTGTVPANDFDLYVLDQSGQVVAQSAFVGGLESTTLDCAAPGAGPYVVRTVYFTTVATPVPNDPGYRGEATWEPAEDPGTCGGPTTAFFDTKRSLTFGPATVVSAHFLGSEPQTTVERELEGFETATDPNRVFVDWPLGSTSTIGQLSRSLDGGDSFRPLLDLRCADRSRPSCVAAGGGDTEDEVNLHTGTLLFSDQEAVVNEAFAASFDHGDTFVSETPLSNPTTATDRQWLTATDASYGVADLSPIEGFLAYHVPCEGQFVQGLARVDTPAGPTIQPLPQPVAQIPNVGQSGQPRVDNNPSSPGYRWVYQPFSTCVGLGQPAGSMTVATALGPDFQRPTAWQANVVDGTSPDIFSWSAIDEAGNAYVVWTTNGVLFLSASPISDPRNDPRVPGGRPGTFWTPKVKITPPGIGSTVFPQVVAGDAGRIAVNYDATTEFAGLPDDAPDTARWHTYAAVIENATSAGGRPPVVVTGQVSHRFVHRGNVCTGGAGCSGTDDRSLLDMIDLGFDQHGRLGVVFTDNFTGFQDIEVGQDLRPFTHYARQASGPRVLASREPKPSTARGSCRDDPGGEATWPNTASGSQLPTLDARRVCLTVEHGNVVGRITLADADVADMLADLQRFNTVPCLPTPLCQADRLQYVVRFLTDSDIFHLSMEVLPSGALRFLAGKLDANDRVTNPATGTVIAAGYHTDSLVNGSIDPATRTIVLTAPASQFGIGIGTAVFSVTAFTMAGPLETSERFVSDVMRTVDATPPADLILSRR